MGGKQGNGYRENERATLLLLQSALIEIKQLEEESLLTQ